MVIMPKRKLTKSERYQLALKKHIKYLRSLGLNVDHNLTVVSILMLLVEHLILAPRQDYLKYLYQIKLVMVGLNQIIVGRLKSLKTLQLFLLITKVPIWSLTKEI